MIKSEVDFNVSDESFMNELTAKLEGLGWSICESPVTLGTAKNEEKADDEEDFIADNGGSSSEI